MIKKAREYWILDCENAWYKTIHSFGTFTSLEMPYRCYCEQKTFFSHVELHKEMRVLELGCGVGRWGVSLAPHVAQYVGVDLNTSVVAEARKQTEYLSNVRFVAMNVEDFLTETVELFDVIYIAGISLYFSDDSLKRLIDLALRHLLPGGQLIERTTTSPERHFLSHDAYIALYRREEEVKEIFMKASKRKLVLKAVVRSYPFLRGRFFFQCLERLANKVSIIRKIFKIKMVLKVMMLASVFCEKISPSLSIEAKYAYDHKFFFFILPRGK